MLIISAAIILDKSGPKAALPGVTTETLGASPGGGQLDEMSVSSTVEKQNLQKKVHSAATPLAEETSLAGGDRGIKAFLLKLAGMSLRDPQTVTRLRTGGRIEPNKVRTEPFIAKRTESGDVALVIDDDPGNLKLLYNKFFLVSADRTKELSRGVVTGNTVIFPGSGPGKVDETALIVRQKGGIIGGCLQVSWRAVHPIESMRPRTQFCALGDAFLAASNKEASA